MHLINALVFEKNFLVRDCYILHSTADRLDHLAFSLNKHLGF